MALLPPRIAAWRRDAPAAEERTVILRPRASTETAEAVRQVQEAGARVESAGAGAMTVVVSPESLEAVAALPWVAAVEEPRTLQAKLPKR